MPLLRIQTNQTLDAESRTELATNGAELVAQLLEKSIDYVQVVVESGCTMTFGGTSEPTAFLELRGLGLDSQDRSRIAEKLTSWVTEKISVEASRVFINFLAIARSDWGWNGSTFE